MADLSITAANVHIYLGARLEEKKLFAGTYTNGQAVVLVSDQWTLADANTEYSDSVRIGVVIVGAASGQAGIVCEYGPIDVGATLTLGNPIIVSTTAGGLAPSSDWAGGPYASAFQYHVGYPQTTSKLFIKPYKTGAEVA